MVLLTAGRLLCSELGETLGSLLFTGGEEKPRRPLDPCTGQKTSRPLVSQ